MWFSTADPKHILQIEGFWCIMGEFNSKHPCSVWSLLQTFECLPVMRARPQNSGSITNYWKNLGVCHIWLSWMLFNFTPINERSHVDQFIVLPHYNYIAWQESLWNKKLTRIFFIGRQLASVFWFVLYVTKSQSLNLNVKAEYLVWEKEAIRCGHMCNQL